MGLGVNIVFALDNISVLLLFFQTDGHLGKDYPGKTCVKRFFLEKGIVIWRCEQLQTMHFWPIVL